MPSAPRPRSFAALALAWAIGLTAPVQALASPSHLPAGTPDMPGLVVVLEGGAHLAVEGKVRVSVQEGEGIQLTELADDGRGVDASAGDGILSALAPVSLARGAVVILLDAEDTVIWQDRLQVGAEVANPRLDIVLDGAQVKVEVITQARTRRQGGGQQLVAPPPPTQNVTGLMVGMMLACLALGVALGINIGPALARRIHRRRGGVVSLGPATIALPPGTPPLDRPRLWSCPDDGTRGQATMSLATHLAQQHAVLVVLSPERLAACRAELERLPTTVILATPRPGVARLIRTWRAQQGGRPVVVLVEGVDALDAREPEEPVDVVIEELLDDAPPDAPFLVLLSEHELGLLWNRVDLALTAVPGGFGPKGGPAILATHPDGVKLAPPSQETPTPC